MALHRRDRTEYVSPRGPVSLSRIPDGTLAVIVPGTLLPIVILLGKSFQVGDGELIVAAAADFIHFPPGGWMAIGRLRHDDERGSWLAVERFAEHKP